MKSWGKNSAPYRISGPDSGPGPGEFSENLILREIRLT